MVNRAVLSLGASERDHLFNDLWNGIRRGANRARARNAAERPHPAFDSLRLFAGKKLARRVNQHDRAVPHNGLALTSVVKRNDRNVFRMDVEPHVELRPIRQRKNANALRFLDARVKKIPEFGALILRVPLAMRITKGVDALLGTGFFLVAPRSAKGRVEPSLSKRIEQGLRF